jgi:hypothetical protein
MPDDDWFNTAWGALVAAAAGAAIGAVLGVLWLMARAVVQRYG